MGRLSSLLSSGLLILAMGRPLGAQLPVVIDIGAIAARFYEEDASASGPYARIFGSYAAQRWFAAFDAGALTSIGASSGFGTITGGLRTGTGFGWNSGVDLELSSVAGTGHSGAAATGLASARTSWSRNGGALWMRGAAHGSSRENTTLSGGSVELGGWIDWPNAQVAASLLHEWTRAELFTGSFHSGFAGTAPVSYSEGTLAMRIEGDRATFDGSATLRRDPDAPSVWDAGVTASAALWTGSNTALLFSAARVLPDWVHGTDAANSVSVGVRLWQPTPVVTRNFRVLPVVQVSDTAGSRVLRVHAAGARSVDVMGDFTDWQPRALTRNGSAFECAVRLSSGSHRLVIRIDGGAWRTAVNTPAVDDDFGGKVGLLVVP